MTYKDTVLTLLENYPTMFANRLHVDEQLFAVVGNGYKWVDGQLIETDDLERTPSGYIVKIPQVQNKYPEIPENLKDFYLDYSYKACNDYVIKNFRRNIADTSNAFKLYPISKRYSAIANIPDDIQQDWLKAALHFVNFCLTNTIVLNLEERPDQIDILKNAKIRLESLKID